MRTLLCFVILFLCSIPAFAQDKPAGITSSGTLASGAVKPSDIRTSEPSQAFDASYSESIESVTLSEGKPEIVKRSTRVPSLIPAIACFPGPCDWTIRRVWKEVYAVKDGKIILEATIEGKISPATKEAYEWPK